MTNVEEPDVWFAALAIESGCEWITTDLDYEKFSGLTLAASTHRECRQINSAGCFASVIRKAA